MPHRYELGTFLSATLFLQNFNPQGYQPIHNSKEHVHGARRLEVSAHLDTEEVFVLFVCACTVVATVKLWTASKSAVSLISTLNIKENFLI